MKIIIDAFGGDNAPLEILKGALLAKEKYGCDLVLAGNEEQILACAKENGLDLNGMEILNAENTIPVEVDPFRIRHEYSECSLAVGLKALAAGEGDAFVSAGSTGAIVVGANLFVKRIKGVRKAAIASIIPGDKGPYLLLDCGANDNCSPDVLNFFGLMGSIYMEKVMGVENPRVGLANIGVEPNKGTDLLRGAYELLAANDKINFIGNVEVRDVPFTAADVVVADGFTGNVILKVLEGTSKMLLGNIKTIFTANLGTKLSYLGVKRGMAGLKDKFDSKKVGGAPLMGVRKPVIKAHGSSNAEAVMNAVGQAITYAETGVIDIIEQNTPKRERPARSSDGENQ
ncbi:MAG: phosphate acyltransferase PlsX [Clostridia bacterium]|nr:phosphate acyltransferase PlsX [Clostridia bacterium]